MESVTLTLDHYEDLKRKSIEWETMQQRHDNAIAEFDVLIKEYVSTTARLFNKNHYVKVVCDAKKIPTGATIVNNGDGDIGILFAYNK